MLIATLRCMRAWAVWRHAVVNAVLEGGDPAAWPAHMRVIDAVYGDLD